MDWTANTKFTDILILKYNKTNWFEPVIIRKYVTHTTHQTKHYRLLANEGKTIPVCNRPFKQGNINIIISEFIWRKLYYLIVMSHYEKT